MGVFLKKKPSEILEICLRSSMNDVKLYSQEANLSYITRLEYALIVSKSRWTYNLK